MGGSTAANGQQTDAQLAKGIRARATHVLVGLLVYAVVLFGGAGTLRWAAAWVLMAIFVALLAVNALIMLRRDRELIAERGRMTPTKNTWDYWLGLVSAGVGPLVLLLVAGLDRRWSWSAPVSPVIQGVALFLVAAGYALWAWAMDSNRYFACFVRIQDERGHQVASSGPYRWVRHPAYAGLVLYTPAMAIGLGSLWALVPAAVAVAAVVARTALEDRTLRAELPGYADFASRVRHRLLPGVW